MKKKIHVVHLLNDFSLYPVHLLIEALNKEGIESEILCTGNAIGSETVNARIRPITITDRSGLSIAREIQNILQEKKSPALLHIHDHALLGWKMFFLSLLRVRSVLSLHRFSEEKISLLASSFYQSMIADSEYIKKNILKNSNIAISQINVIHRGIRPADIQKRDASTQPIRAQIGATENDFIVGNAEDFTRENDHLTLLKAVRKLAQKKAPFRLILTGKGPLEKDLKDAVAEYGLSNVVHFLNLDERPFLETIDTAASASFATECSPQILEAMSAGKPVVVTKIGENPEYLHDGAEGYLVPCGFPERIEAALMRLQVNRSQAEKMGVAAKLRIDTYFTWNTIAHRYAEIYARAVK